MSAGVARRVEVKDTVVGAGGSHDGSGGEIRIAFDVTQKAGGRSAAGFFRLTDGASGTRIDMKNPGLLQTTAKWASFTGRAALRPGEPPQAITVIVEQADPFDDGRATVTVDGEAGYRLSGAIAAESLVLSGRPVR
jgi:hypothetical protein